LVVLEFRCGITANTHNSVFLHLPSQGDRVYNTCLVMNPEGGIVGVPVSWWDAWWDG
jgi:hypothetical protein